jgi:hypothetical protein
VTYPTVPIIESQNNEAGSCGGGGEAGLVERRERMVGDGVRCCGARVDLHRVHRRAVYVGRDAEVEVACGAAPCVRDGSRKAATSVAVYDSPAPEADAQMLLPSNFYEFIQKGRGHIRGIQ